MLTSFKVIAHLIKGVLLWSLALTMGAQIAFAGETTTTVTTYVVRTQEERQQTRWTLTEWLRIKERMKLMDVWLAMFSDPNKDKFSPELNVSYSLTSSAMRRQTNELTTDEGKGSGSTFRSQLWLTNLISSKVGIRTMNVDFGFEAGGHTSGTYKSTSANTTNNVSTSLADNPIANTNWYTFDLRLFGKHIQDSSLVLKYGLMQTTNSFQLPSSGTTPTSIGKTSSQLATGSTLGGELQLYLIPVMGLEGSLHQYRASTVSYSDHTLTGGFGEALAFIEIGLLRLQGGIYEERWNATWDDVKTSTYEHGYVGGLKILL
jgi:hypothetical protein